MLQTNQKFQTFEDYLAYDDNSDKWYKQYLDHHSLLGWVKL